MARLCKGFLLYCIILLDMWCDVVRKKKKRKRYYRRDQQLNPIRKRVLARDESRGMRLMHEAFAESTARRDDWKDGGKNEIQFNLRTLPPSLFNVDLRCKMRNEITRRSKRSSLSLCLKLICADRWINVGDLIPSLLENHMWHWLT